jgi:hypothetical protein
MDVLLQNENALARYGVMAKGSDALKRATKKTGIVRVT